jgi:antitoxin component of RelBE/YafQ-DinJ toxin-antitoxin module
MSQQTTSFRIKENLKEKVDLYLEKNQLSFTALANMALEKFISEPTTITLLPVDDDEFVAKSKKMMKKYKHTIDKLK